MLKNFLLLACLWGIMGLNDSFAQSSDDLYKQADLSNLSFFKPNAGNWQIAGGVTADLKKDGVLNTEAGTGILVNLPNTKQKSNLFTTLEHGDIDLDLEFMMAKHSNSGIYLMGRYEIQLLDSWGHKNPKYGDLGGIYARRDENGKNFEGNAPRSNAAKAPGLWQKMHIEFQAPRFDALGNKTQNARVIKVVLNGTVVQENVELTGPTGGPAFKEEGPIGPIMIQGDHGPVAFRNFKYKLYEPTKLIPENLSYKVYKGNFSAIPDFTKEKPIQSGKLKELTQEIVTENEKFLFVVKGILDLKESGNYAFDLNVRGFGELSVGGKKVIDFGWWDQSGTVELEAGKQAFEIVYSKPDSWYPNALGLFISGPGLRTQTLHTLNSMPMSNPVNPIGIAVGDQTQITRCFIDYKQTPDSKRRRIVHAISVGFPGGTSFTFDADRANLAQVWKGDYLNATPMWHNRGDGSSRPEGTLLPLQDKAGFNKLATENTEWNDDLADNLKYKFKGYEVDGDNNPTFHYQAGNATFTDKISPEEGGKSLLREISVSGTNPSILILLGSGKEIKALKGDLYSIDQNYYIKVKGNAKVRSIDGEQQLVLPIETKDATISYSIIW